MMFNRAAAITIAIGTATLCGAPLPDGEKRVRFVEPGFAALNGSMPLPEMVRQVTAMRGIAMNYPERGFSVGEAVEYVQARLAESQMDCALLFETKMRRPDFQREYLDKPLTKAFGFELKGTALDRFRKRLSCYEMLLVIQENTGWRMVYSNGGIVMTDNGD